MYVTDSLFFMQHLMGNIENDEDRKILLVKYRDMFTKHDEAPKESADEIKNRLIKKSLELSGGNNE